VYALYNRRRWVAVITASLLTVEAVACSVMIPLTLSRVTFNPFCYITLPTYINVALRFALPSSRVVHSLMVCPPIYSLVSLVPPVTAFFFILAKQIIGIRDGWGNTPLMMLLMRDGTWGIVGLVGESRFLTLASNPEPRMNRSMGRQPALGNHHW
jgi:hypothetical protein